MEFLEKVFDEFKPLIGGIVALAFLATLALQYGFLKW